MRLKRGFVGLAMAIAVLLGSGTAEAGLTAKTIDWFYITPFIGAETTHFGSIGFNGAQDTTAAGLTFGGIAGIRLSPINFGILVQRTQFDAGMGSSFGVDKIYGEFGFNSQLANFVLNIHFDFGFAYLSGDGGGPALQGFGGKLGIALDFYPIRLLSVGVGLDFDMQGYSTSQDLSGAFGGTYVGRIGLHF